MPISRRAPSRSPRAATEPTRNLVRSERVGPTGRPSRIPGVSAGGRHEPAGGAWNRRAAPTGRGRAPPGTGGHAPAETGGPIAGSEPENPADPVSEGSPSGLRARIRAFWDPEAVTIRAQSPNSSRIQGLSGSTMPDSRAVSPRRSPPLPTSACDACLGRTRGTAKGHSTNEAGFRRRLAPDQGRSSSDHAGSATSFVHWCGGDPQGRAAGGDLERRQPHPGRARDRGRYARPAAAISPSQRR